MSAAPAALARKRSGTGMLQVISSETVQPGDTADGGDYAQIRRLMNRTATTGAATSRR